MRIQGTNMCSSASHIFFIMLLLDALNKKLLTLNILGLVGCFHTMNPRYLTYFGKYVLAYALSRLGWISIQIFCCFFFKTKQKKSII